MTLAPPPLPRLRPAVRDGLAAFWAAALAPQDGLELPLAPAEVARVVAVALAAAEEDPAALGLPGPPGDGWYDADGSQVGAELLALLDHVRDMVATPRACGQGSVERVLAAGSTPQRLVAASQVATFVVFCARLVRAHRALEAVLGGGGATAGGDAVVGAAPAEVATGQAPGHPRDEYPLMGWTAWLPTAAPAPDVAAADDAKGASDYYLVLSHVPALLHRRTELYDEVMTGEGALERADRELVALATSLQTGCSFCASVHGRRHFALTRDTVSTPLLRHAGPSALPTARERALAHLGAALATTPASVTEGHVGALLEAGLDAEQVMDAAAVGAMFTWANRLMLTLGTGSPVVRPPRRAAGAARPA